MSRIVSDPLEAMKAARLLLFLAIGAEKDGLERATSGSYCGGCDECCRLEPVGLRDLEHMEKLLSEMVERLEKK